SNGTWSGSTRIDERVMHDGELFSCGSVTFVVVDLAGGAGDTRVLTDRGIAMAIADQQNTRSWRAGDDPNDLAAIHRIQQVAMASEPAQRPAAVAAAVATELGCPLCAVVLRGRVAGTMSRRLAHRLAQGDSARLLRLGRELNGQTVAAEAVGSALTAPLGTRGHLVAARSVDDEACTAAELRLIAAFAAELSEAFTAVGDLPELVGQGPVMQLLRERISRIATTDASVLVSGASGTGKELVARALHRLSGRAAGPFIAVNCAAVSESLFEAELFGHERGAFTGADSARPGRFRQADGGTLFLDEIGELPERLQPKLLRALQEGVVEPVGGVAEIPVDVRVVAATNRDLQAEVDAGAFRADLFYRLDVIRIHTPALAEHPDDIPALAAHLLRQAARETGIAEAGISEAALDVLSQAPWPGNVRQLSNLLTRALVAAEGPIDVHHLALRDVPAAPVDDSGPFLSLAEVEAAHVRAALQRTGGNKTAAARLLGISRPTVLKKIADYGIVWE
ncbi:MAG: sigma-54 dependent transcriptional regulator, partial [Planctomycetota bacterium]|nr:sigma-54 dependent transcriptional regulator [Planctomycetota bacterium]